MTATPARTADRFPVRRDVDGDFTPAQILAALPRAPQDGHPVPLAGVAESAHAARLWLPAVATEESLPSGPAVPLLPDHGQADALACDADLLHRFETAPLWRPPVEARTRALSPRVAGAWLTLADHWIGLSRVSDDLRFLNGACKLLGTVWTRHSADHWNDPELTTRIAVTAARLDGACTQLSARLSNRVLPPGPATGPGDHQQSDRPAMRGGMKTVVLARLGSASPAAFLTTARTLGAEVSAVCWYAPPGDTAEPSGYSAAWYPPEPAPRSRLTLDVTSSTAHCIDWDQVESVLARWEPDLLVLLGMPIVPAAILTIPTLATINAHNGALPTYRGMDAVGWALLNNDPITCSVHRVTAGVDTGPVLLTQAVPISPRSTLRQRVKSTQLTLLSAVTVHTASAHRLPDGVSQPPHLARQFYRLHPHLKRILDASPYGIGGTR
ncbi:formyltransferase family protein [Streptomyces brasiliscabiei]|uniref:formyltransferase family protein n=1 Tax=Streptomyces brasiliscabiei TaxID=2736302 RepID=UPI001C0FA746|nr:formyltransferase family protein [Streptomyces brasiliscabiei]